MPELGDPTSYLQVSDGVPVLSADGRTIGTLAHVLADEATDIFDGIVIDARSEIGGWRFADASEVDDLHEGGVVLSLGFEECGRLPQPSENPPAMGTDPAEVGGGTVADKLRRAWDYITGNY